MADDLLPPNATPLMRAAARATAPLGDVPVPLRVLMNPETIPVDLLPWLAWHLGVTAWSNAWPEQVRRARVKVAIPVARKSGTVAAVRDAVESFGANIVIREWFEQNPPAAPYTFELFMVVAAREGSPPSAAYVADILREVDRAKPVRAHYTFTQGLSKQLRQPIGGAARVAVYRRLNLSESQSEAK